MGFESTLNSRFHSACGVVGSWPPHCTFSYIYFIIGMRDARMQDVGLSIINTRLAHAWHGGPNLSAGRNLHPARL